MSNASTHNVRKSDSSKKIDRNRLMKDLFQSSSKIPPYAQGVYEDTPVYNTIRSTEPFAKMTVVVYPLVRTKHPNGMPAKSSTHRIMVVCERCEQEVPFGRYHMHYGAKTCTPIPKPMGEEQMFIQEIDEGDYLALSAYADWLEEKCLNIDMVYGLRIIVKRKMEPSIVNPYTWYEVDLPCMLDEVNEQEIELLTGEEVPSPYASNDHRLRAKRYNKRSDAYLDFARVLHKLYANKE
jgi:hypothetical protein